MSITATYSIPQLWTPAYNPIIYSFKSDQSAQPDFSYVIDIYVASITFGATQTLRLYQKPNPSGVGIVDVSNIVQSYISLSNFYGTETGATGGLAYAPYGNPFPVTYPLAAGNYPWNAVAGVYIVVGEQYQVGGVLTMYDGFGNPGDPAYDIFSKYASEPVRCVPGAIPYPESVSNITAASIASSFYGPYIMDGDGLFLSRLGTTQSIMTNQHHSLSFLNQWDLGPGSYAYSVQGMEVIYYNSAGGVISSTFVYNNTVAGGGPQTANNYTAVTFNLKYSILQFNCGTRFLNPPANTAYYTVQAYRKSSATTSTTPGTACSALYRFNIVSRPCNDLYPPVRVAWLNDLGGRDYYNFTMLYEKSTTSDYDTWFQTSVNWDGQFAYPTTQNGDWWLRGGPKTFNKVVTTKFIIQTDWLLQAEVDALGQIPESSQVWAYIGQSVDQPQSIQVTNIDYTYSNVGQQKLVQATLECQYSKPQPKQNM